MKVSGPYYDKRGRNLPVTVTVRAGDRAEVHRFRDDADGWDEAREFVDQLKAG